MPSPLSHLHRAYRRSGADLPFGDPRRAHGVGMEGYFWRIADARSGRVVVVLCGACRSDAGDWSLVGIAGHPGAVLLSEQAVAATADPDGCAVVVPGVLDGSDAHLRAELPGGLVDVRFEDPRRFPAGAFGSLGPAQAVPFLHQYWHAHLLSARVTGHAVLGGERIDLDGATAYSEKNWGREFAGDWWWGQASGLGDDPDAHLAFAGGHLDVGPLRVSPTSLVAGAGGETLRLVPPLAVLQASVADGALRLRARSPRVTVEVEAEADGRAPYMLPVPLPARRECVYTSHHHLAARMEVTVRRGARVVFRGESRLAGLERGVARPA